MTRVNNLMTRPIPKIASELATSEEEVAVVEEEEGTDERIASEELLWRRMRMEDNIETAFTFSNNNSNRSTSAAFRPSHCRKEADDSSL